MRITERQLDTGKYVAVYAYEYNGLLITKVCSYLARNFTTNFIVKALPEGKIVYVENDIEYTCDIETITKPSGLVNDLIYTSINIAPYITNPDKIINMNNNGVLACQKDGIVYGNLRYSFGGDGVRKFLEGSTNIIDDSDSINDLLAARQRFLTELRVIELKIKRAKFVGSIQNNIEVLEGDNYKFIYSPEIAKGVMEIGGENFLISSSLIKLTYIEYSFNGKDVLHPVFINTNQDQFVLAMNQSMIDNNQRALERTIKNLINSVPSYVVDQMEKGMIDFIEMEVDDASN